MGRLDALPPRFERGVATFARWPNGGLIVALASGLLKVAAVALANAGVRVYTQGRAITGDAC